MARFKKGDKVRCISVCDGSSFIVGRTYTVASDVHSDNDLVGIEGEDQEMFPFRFELVATAPEPRFKVGDRVRYTTGTPHYGADVDIGEMTIVSIGGGDWDDNVDLNYRGDYQQTARLVDLELIQPTATTRSIVCLIENGQPKPADQPHVHTTRSDAEREATRLAGKHKGKEFGVFELVTTKREAAPVYAHEWQRLAAEGRRIDAIKLYRETGGRRPTFVAATHYRPAGYEDRHVIGLAEAKDAVEHFLQAA